MQASNFIGRRSGIIAMAVYFSPWSILTIAAIDDIAAAMAKNGYADSAKNEAIAIL